jgi:hypothetical protein
MSRDKLNKIFFLAICIFIAYLIKTQLDISNIPTDDNVPPPPTDDNVPPPPTDDNVHPPPTDDNVPPPPQNTPIEYSPVQNPPVTVVEPGSLKIEKPTYSSPESTTGSTENIAISIAADPFLIYTIVRSGIVLGLVQIGKQHLLRSASSVLKALGRKLGTEALIRVGAVAGQKAAAIASQRLAAKAAARAATAAGTRVSTAAVTAAAGGPIAPFIFMAEMSFIALSIGLDLGDAGGYMKMTTNNMYVDMKKEFDKEFNKTILEIEIDDVDKDGKPIKVKLTEKDIPIIIGPQIPHKTDKDFEKYIDDGFKILNDNNDPILNPFWDKINEDLAKGVITATDLLRKDVEVYYRSYCDLKKVYEKIQNNHCIINNGKIILLENGKYACSYKDKSSCENSYKWPLEQDENDEMPKEPYAEYKSKLLNGVCILANPNLRSICELNNLNYDTDTGLCKVTKDYCLKKGADWKDNDCHISKGQDIAELIFGSTIVRGLKQALDPTQYESCKEGETDDGYFCRSVGCSDGSEQWENAGVCYPKCKPGFKPDGCCYCGPKTHGVPVATTRDICPPNTYPSTSGLCRDDCASGTNDVASVCWNPCKPGETDTGALCREKCAEGYHDHLGVCWANSCPSGSSYASPGLCRYNCREGYHDVAGVCWKNNTKDHIIGRGWGWGFGWHDCGKNEETGKDNVKRGALCYPACPDRYFESTVNICESIDPLSYVEATVARHSYTPKTYEKSTKVSEVREAICPSHKQNYGGFCYEKCADGYSMKTAGICSFDGESYGRGVGWPAVKTRAKKRIIPFSTKDN